MTEAANPYAPPQAAVDDVVPGEDRAVRVRKEHLLHEVRLKSVGLLYYLVALLSLLTFLPGFVHLPPQIDSGQLTMMGLAAAFTMFMAAIGWGFRHLRPWVRLPGGLLSAVGLLAFPLGTLIGAYVLFLLFGSKGNTVLAKDYAAILAATPGLKYRRTLGDCIAIGVVVSIPVALILLALFG